MSDQVQENDKQVLKNLAEMGAKLKELAWKAENLELQAKAAKKEYDEYRTMTLPMAMFEAGLRDLTLQDGTRMGIETKITCSPNKNSEDRAIIAAWLKEKNAPSDLFEEKAVIATDFLDKVKDVPHETVLDMNTNKLKKWISESLGLKGGAPQFNIEDIPPCIHFYMMDEVKINL